MRAVPHTDLAAFWDRAEPSYRADPIRNTIALTVLRGLLTDPDPAAEPPLLVTFEDNGHTIGAAYCTPPWPLSVSATPDGAAPALVALLRELAYPVTGVSGPLELADQFSAEWRKATDAKEIDAVRLRLYRLGTLTRPEVAGTPRLATAADIALLARWRVAFGEDIGHLPDDDHTEFIRRTMALGTARILWEVDGTPVASAAATKPVAGMSRVGQVYTPPEHRGRGYGSAATAAISQWALDAGADDVVLYADLANPTSNGIYQKIGYLPHHDAADYGFTS